MLRIYTSEQAKPEKTYVFHVLFRELLGIDFLLIPAAQNDYVIELPNGAKITIEDHFFSKWGDAYVTTAALPGTVTLLTDAKKRFDPLLGLYGRAMLTEKKDEIFCGLDLVASSFFMLSRWEEFVQTNRDEHGRFPAHAAFSCQHNFLHRPIVNEYADALRALFFYLGVELKTFPRVFQFSFTCDVDHPRLWWHKFGPVKTALGALVKRKSLEELKYWRYFNSKKDPYDCFDEWLKLLEEQGLKAQFNFLGERAPSSDCYYPIHHPFVVQLIKKLTERGHNIGFHPSYEAFDDAKLFNQELASLQAISPQPVQSGRQHYLRFAVPDTWRTWENAGMTWESSMAYAEKNGFRCGICCPFPVFDLKSRKTLQLYERPLIAMDVTLAIYQKLRPEQGLEALLHLKKTVFKHRGEFVLLWHNSSWNTPLWENWKYVLRTVLKQQ